MRGIPAHYHDGRSSGRTAVTLFLDGDRLRISGPSLDKTVPLRDARISSGIGAIRRTLRFPDGSQCEVAGDAGLDDLLGRQGKGRLGRLLHRWERSLPLATAALLVTVIIVILLVKFGIPAAARRVAFTLPPATEETLGREALGMLDRMVFAPSRLPNERQRQVRLLYQDMSRDIPELRTTRLEFRSSDKVGANAFALPSGIIVVTDGLVNLARDDREITGVLAHEAGHLVNRHALRHVLQNSGTALLIALLTGDITSVSSFSAGLPTALVEAKYSRDFENEADDAAIAYLRRHNIPVSAYTGMLERLEADHGAKKGKDHPGAKKERKEEGSLSDYFSSHPVTRERIERITKGR